MRKMSASTESVCSNILYWNGTWWYAWMAFSSYYRHHVVYRREAINETDNPSAEDNQQNRVFFIENVHISWILLLYVSCDLYEQNERAKIQQPQQQRWIQLIEQYINLDRKRKLIRVRMLNVVFILLCIPCEFTVILFDEMYVVQRIHQIDCTNPISWNFTFSPYLGCADTVYIVNDESYLEIIGHD